MMNPDELGASNNAYSTDEIRQIQALMALCSCLPPNGKLCEVLKHALALPRETCLSRATPVSDTSWHGLKAWLESQWAQGGLTPNEQKLVDWQNASENVGAAVRELRDVEQKIGLKLAIVKM
jgi:hypothetical protein